MGWLIPKLALMFSSCKSLQVERSIHDINQNVESILLLLKEESQARSAGNQILKDTSDLDHLKAAPRCSKPVVYTASALLPNSAGLHGSQHLLLSESLQAAMGTVTSQTQCVSIAGISTSEPFSLHPQPKTNFDFSPSLITASLPDQSGIKAEQQEVIFLAAQLNPEQVTLQCDAISGFIAGCDENTILSAATPAASESMGTTKVHKFSRINALAEVPSSDQPEGHQQLGKQSLIMVPASPTIVSVPPCLTPAVTTHSVYLQHQNNHSGYFSAPELESSRLQGAMQENIHGSKCYGGSNFSPDVHAMHRTLSTGQITTKYMI